MAAAASESDVTEMCQVSPATASGTVIGAAPPRSAAAASTQLRLRRARVWIHQIPVHQRPPRPLLDQLSDRVTSSIRTGPIYRFP